MNQNPRLERFFEDLFGSAGKAGSLELFLPELALCAFMLAMLVVRIAAPRWRNSPFYLSVAGLLTALGLVIGAGLPPAPKEIFTGMLVLDGLAWYLRGLVLLGTLVVVSLTALTRMVSDEGDLEFYFLLLGACLGMCLMVSANHLVMVMVGLEMASICSYVLAGILRDRRQGMEAALKYAVFGAATAGVMLYGMSLLAGVLGSVHLPTMARRLAGLLLAAQNAAGGTGHGPVLLLGGVMLLVGLAFKLSAFPFHFWAPDVMEGAPAEVGGFLSVVSKTAALGLLARLALVLSLPGPSGESLEASEALQALEPARQTLTVLLALVAAVTCTFGNLAAYGQTNMKRLMAYSTIAHAGYLIMPIAAMAASAGRDVESAQNALASLLFYTTVYLWMNLGVFGFVALVRDQTGREDIETYRVLGRHSPGVAVLMAIQLFSLVGLPPLGGFMAKFTVFASLWQCGLKALLLIAVLNTVLSLFYYLRVIRVMALASDPIGQAGGAPEKDSPDSSAGLSADQGTSVPVRMPLLSWGGMWLLVVAVPVVVLGLWWNGLFALVQAVAAGSW